MNKQELILNLKNKLTKRVKEGYFKQEITDIYLENFNNSLEELLNDDFKNKEISKIILKNNYNYYNNGCGWYINIFVKYINNWRNESYLYTHIKLNCNSTCAICVNRKNQKQKELDIQNKQENCLHNEDVYIKRADYKTTLHCKLCNKVIKDIYTSDINKILFTKYENEIIEIIKEKGEQ